MIVRIIKSARDIVALCDADLIGKKFEEGDFCLEVKENFFVGEKVDERKAIEVLKKMQREDATFNIVGKRSIAAALKAGIINKEEIKEIQGVKFALVLL